MFTIPQSTAWKAPLQAYLSSDHVTPATGKTIAITISKNGGAYGNPSGGATNATEIANGSYYVGLTTTDTNTLGPLFVRGSVSGIDDVILILNIVKATNGGLTALPDTAVTTNASLLTSGTGTDQISNTTGRVDLGKILGTTSAGTAGYVGIDWSNVNAPTTTVGLTGTTIATSQVVASVTGAVGSVTGAVGSVTGAVGSVTSGVTVTTNSDKTGYTLTNAGYAAVMTQQLTESYAAKGTVPTPAQLLLEVRALLAENNVASTTVTTKKIDGSTSAHTYTLNSSTAPTTITTAS